MPNDLEKHASAVAKPLSLQLVAGDPTLAAKLASMMAANTINEIVILSFGHYDPMAPVKEGVASAPVFSQIAIGRTAFSQFVGAAIRMLNATPDKEVFGWKEVVAAIEATEGGSDAERDTTDT